MKNGLSKLHYRFRRYPTLTIQFCLNLNICKVTDDDSLPDVLRPKFEGDRHNFADIEIEAKLS